MIDKKHMRRNYLINARFQFKYTAAITATLLVIMLVSGAGLYVGMWGSIIENFSKFKVSENLENVRRIADYEGVRYKRGDIRLERIFKEAELLSQKEQEVLREALRCVNRSLIPKVLLLMLAIFIAGIFISHKIAGPMYRIERSAAAIRNGDLSVNFNIRKSDEMKTTALVLEEMLESLRSDMEKIKVKTAILKEKINSLTPRLPEGDVEEIKIIVNEIDRLLAKYKT